MSVGHFHVEASGGKQIVVEFFGIREGKETQVESSSYKGHKQNGHSQADSLDEFRHSNSNYIKA